ncbi:hypothetical protein CYMTET_5609, partial [Cymbomonas tetramitiformis]
RPAERDEAFLTRGSVHEEGAGEEKDEGEGKRLLGTGGGAAGRARGRRGEARAHPTAPRGAVVLRNGWLLKEDAGGGWKLRFCVLVPGRLLCYTSADCTEPKGSFLLAEDTQVSTEDARRPDPTYAFALSAKSHLRSLSLSAATQTNQHEWVDAMLAAKRPGLPFEAGSSVVVHMGWLHKQDKMGRGWKKRFFVLRGPWLSYYLDERCRERLGEMAIAASAMVTVMDATVSLPGSILASAITHTQVVVHQVLSLQSEGRELVLAAEEEIVLDKWAQVLDAAQDARQVQEPAKKVLATSRASGNTALREGWLMRLAEDGTWEETYAVLTAQQLLCYSGEDCVEGIGSRPTLRSTVHLLGWHGVPLRGQTGLINVFRFALSWSAQRAEDLAALEEEDAYAWEADIKHAAARIGAVMGVSAQPGSQLLGNRAIDDRGMGTGPYKEGWIVIGKCVGGLGKPPQPGAVPPLTFAEGRQAQVASWKQRYAVLCGKSLTLYTDHTYLDPRGELQLEGAGVQGMGQALEGLERQPSHMQLHPHLLKLTIVAPGRQQNSPSTAESLLMGLSTQREAQLWREQLLHGKTEAELPTSPGGYQLQIASSGAGSSPWRGAAGRSVLLEGWLEKERRGGAREWRMRYFVLRPGRLAYFTDHTCHVLKGELSLVEAIVAGPDERARYNEDMHLSRDTRRYFTVGTPTRVLGLAAEDSQSAAAWCDAIEAAAGTMQATSNADVALTPVTLAIEKQLAISQEEVRIYLPDGSFELVPVSETTMASDVAALIARKIGLAAPLPHFALVESETAALGAPFRVLHEADPLREITEGWRFDSLRYDAARQAAGMGSAIPCLMFRKVLFLVEEELANVDLNDPVLAHLMYSQLRLDVSQRMPIVEEDALQLASLQAKIELQDQKERPPKGFLVDHLQRYLPPNMWAKGLDGGCNYSEAVHWEDEVSRRFEALPMSWTLLQHKQEYMRIVARSPLFGCIFHDVDVKESLRWRLPDVLTLGINENGIHLLDPHSKSLLQSFPYGSIYRWGHTNRSFAMFIGAEQSKVVFATAKGKGQEMALFASTYASLLAKR